MGNDFESSPEQKLIEKKVMLKNDIEHLEKQFERLCERIEEKEIEIKGLKKRKETLFRTLFNKKKELNEL